MDGGRDRRLAGASFLLTDRLIAEGTKRPAKDTVARRDRFWKIFLPPGRTKGNSDSSGP